MTKTKTTTAGKTAKMLSMFALACGLLFTNCAKDGATGPAGPAGPAGATGQAGPQAKTFTFTLVFTSADTYKSYSGITGFNQDDVLLVYVFNANYGSDYYVQLPYMAGGSSGVNIYAEFAEDSGNLFINTENADGSVGSPWTSNTTLKFKAVLISSSQFKAHPNTNWGNYNEVKAALNLKD